MGVNPFLKGLAMSSTAQPKLYTSPDRKCHECGKQFHYSKAAIYYDDDSKSYYLGKCPDGHKNSVYFDGPKLEDSIDLSGFVKQQ